MHIWHHYKNNAPYQQWFDQQEEHRVAMLEGTKTSELWLIEHLPAYTLGRGESGEGLLLPEATLKSKGFEVVKTNRGGKITYHGPGQLVAYPVFNLTHFDLGIKAYVCALEEVMKQTLKSFGIEAHRVHAHPGLWCGKRKIGSVGIHVRRQISIHGLSLNVSPDMEAFKNIVSCGIEGVEMTSLELELGKKMNVKEVLGPFVTAFENVFQCKLVGSLNPD